MPHPGPGSLKRFDGIVARNRQEMRTVGHDNVFALPDYAKPSLFEGPNCVEMIDAWPL
jgi:hypothetical protein